MRQHLPQMYGSSFELGRSSLSFNLHVVNSISGALCCFYVSNEWSPCESLMCLICLKLVLSFGRRFTSMGVETMTISYYGVSATMCKSERLCIIAVVFFGCWAHVCITILDELWRLAH